VSNDGDDAVFHKVMCDMANDMAGPVAISGYPTEEYDSWLPAPRWTKYTFDMPNNSGQGKTKQRRTECLWVKRAA
jgi:hypothetical protein